MTHYALIDNNSGFVWGEVNADSPVEACAAIDRELGSQDREYEVTQLPFSNSSGYVVFEAPAGWREVENGQDEAEIGRVLSLCRKAAEVSFETKSQ